MSKTNTAYKRVLKKIKNDERYCLICNKELKDDDPILEILEDPIICTNCKNQFVPLNRIYSLDIDWIVLYQYNEFIERLLFRFKEQRDIELAPIFFYEYVSKIKELSNHYTICTMCSSEKNRMERGFEPILDMLRVHGIEVYSPLYKTQNIKQSSTHKNERDQIVNYIKLKELYKLPKKPILLIDDVITTGSTLKAGISLLKPKKVLVLSANPLWIERVKVEKQKRF